MRIVTQEFRLTPVPKPRQTRSDKWKQRPCVMAYRAFADELRAIAKKARFTMPESGATLVFHLPMPRSWSAKKRDAMNGKPHQVRPDLDNLAKSVFDALCAEDCWIWQLRGIEKRWAEYGRIDVITTPTETPDAR